MISHTLSLFVHFTMYPVIPISEYTLPMCVRLRSLIFTTKACPTTFPQDRHTLEHPYLHPHPQQHYGHCSCQGVPQVGRRGHLLQALLSSWVALLRPLPSSSLLAPTCWRCLKIIIYILSRWLPREPIRAIVGGRIGYLEARHAC